jgi:hypothetical protein
MRAKTSDGSEIHLLISNESPFSNRIRKELLEERKDQLGIKESNDYFREKERPYEDYEAGLKKFLKDKQAKWLLTIYPDEERVQIDTKALLDNLQLNGQRMVCFESGTKLLTSEWSSRKPPPVVCITTDHEASVKLLIRNWLCTRLKGVKKLHFISMLGPEKNSAADRRRAIYNEFLAHISLSRDLAPICKRWDWPNGNTSWHWNDIVELSNSPATLQTTFLWMKNWYRHDAKKIMLEEVDSLNITDTTVRTFFLCGNDDIALGIRDALVHKYGQPPNRDCISFVGFDGIDEMLNRLQGQIQGVTMRVGVDKMCDEVVNVINRKSEEDMGSLVEVPAFIEKSTTH